MQYKELRQCRPDFEKFCKRYQELFRDKRQREHLRSYLQGLLGPLERKSIEPIALEQQTDVRMLQHFIGSSSWDDGAMLVKHQHHVIETIGSSNGVLILDPTAFPKRGDQSVGVARQWCGQLGKLENCQVGVNLTYVSEHGHTFLDRRLYLPRSWACDKARRKAAGVPEGVVFRRSWELAYEMILNARMQGVLHAWITGDEEFGKAPPLHDCLAQLGERYIFEIPVKARVFLTLPGSHIKGPKGLLKQLLEIRPGRPRLMRVDKIAEMLPERVFKPIHIRDASKGPITVQAVALRVRFQRRRSKDRPEGWLVLSQTMDQQRQLKFFESNAGPECSLESLLSAGYARWPIEQDHGQGKNETGLGHYETRTWQGWHHHTALSFLAHHFLVIQRNRLGKKISRDDNRRNTKGYYTDMLQKQAAREVCQEYAISTSAQSRSAPDSLETCHEEQCQAHIAPTYSYPPYIRYYDPQLN